MSLLWPRTQILHILITSQLHGQCGHAIALQTPSRNVLLVDDDPVRNGGGDERQAVRKHRPSGVVPESEIGDEVAKDTEKQGQMPIWTWSTKLIQPERMSKQ